LLKNLKRTGVIGPFYQRHLASTAFAVLCCAVGGGGEFWISNCTEKRPVYKEADRCWTGIAPNQSLKVRDLECGRRKRSLKYSITWDWGYRLMNNRLMMVCLEITLLGENFESSQF